MATLSLDLDPLNQPLLPKEAVLAMQMPAKTHARASVKSFCEAICKYYLAHSVDSGIPEVAIMLNSFSCKLLRAQVRC